MSTLLAPSPSAEHWRLLVDALPDAVFLVDPAGRIVSWGGGAGRILGFSADEMVGQPVGLLYPPEDVPAGRAALDLQTALDRGRCEDEGWRVRRDGPPLRAVTTITALHDQHRHIGFAVVVRPAETESRQAADLLRAVTEGTPDAVFAKDRVGRYVLFNEAASRFVGRPAADVLGRDDTALFDPAGARLVMRRDRRVMESGQAETEEEELTSAGVSRTFVATKAPYRDAAGNVVGVIGISRDVTECKQAEAALRASEERFRLMADAAPVLIWVAGPDQSCHWVNRPWLEFTGRTLEQETGAGRIENVHPDDRRRCLATFSAAFDARVSFSMEYRLRRHDGEYRWVLDNGAPLRGPGGQFAGYIGSCVDITDRRLAEEALRAEWDRFARIAAVAPGVICELRLRPDGTFYFPYASPGLPDIYGVRPDDLAAGAGAVPTLIHPDDAERVGAAVAEAARALAPWRCEFRVRHPVKGEIWIEVRAVPVREPDGTALWHGILMDVTDRKRVEEELAVEQGRLRALVDALPDITFTKDVAGRFTACNQATLELVGVTDASGVVGKTVFDLYPPHLARAYHEDDLRVLQDGVTVHNREEISLDAAGREQWFLTTKAPLRDRDGRITGLVGISRNIQKLKEAEATLRACEERFRSLVNAVQDYALFMLDPDGVVVTWNAGAIRITGYPAAEAEGGSVARLYAPNEAAAGLPAEHLARAAADGRFETEGWRVRKDGTRFWAGVVTTAVRDEAGQLRGFTVIVRDQTDRHRP